MDERPTSDNPSVPNGSDVERTPVHSPLLGMMPHILQTLQREPALAITLTYLLVAMAGIFYDYSFYSKFAIPVLSLSQLSDFLTAGIQQPIALVLVFSTFPLCWAFDRLNTRYRKRNAAKLDRLRAEDSVSFPQRLKLGFVRWRVEQVWYTRLSYLAVIVVYGAMFVGGYAEWRATAVKRGDAQQVRVWLAGADAPLAASGSDRWAYLGATSTYLFVYDHAAAQATALPVNAIARIEPLPRPDSKPPVLVAPIP
ncbi:MAG: hypothetical protein ABW186_09440 [Rhodanobacteraceae bacterium]